MFSASSVQSYLQLCLQYNCNQTSCFALICFMQNQETKEEEEEEEVYRSEERGGGEGEPCDLDGICALLSCVPDVETEGAGEPGGRGGLKAEGLGEVVG